MTEAERLAQSLIEVHDGYADEGPSIFSDAAAELRRLSAELEALNKAISEAEPVAWRCRVGEHAWWLEKDKPSPRLMMEIESLYTLKGIK